MLPRRHGAAHETHFQVGGGASNSSCWWRSSCRRTSSLLTLSSLLGLQLNIKCCCGALQAQDSSRLPGTSSDRAHALRNRLLRQFLERALRRLDERRRNRAEQPAHLLR